MRRFLGHHFLPGLGVAACTMGFLSLGYQIDWPTLFNTLIAFAVSEAIREAAE